ncbi:hypothetical protein SUGI_0752920 [Cryptomeria japonica]|nr:hypothetical protein SUGI_0752920 [Cryptomeria japonica]
MGGENGNCGEAGEAKLAFPLAHITKQEEQEDSAGARELENTSNFTPVCTTKLGRIANYIGEFEKRGVKLLSLSSDEVDAHKAFAPGSKVTYPILAVPKAEIMAKLNMLDPDEKDEIGKPLASRTLHIVGPDKKLKLSFLFVWF